MPKPKYVKGNKVAFTTADGVSHTGEVLQVSKKTYFVMVRSDQDGQHYSCHENHLTRLA